MRIEWDVPIEMDDGVTLRCDVYRPPEDGQYPVIMSSGPYGKWLHFEDGYPHQWKQMCEEHPDVPADSTNKYQAWEVADPEMWVPEGYAVVRIDSRGASRSPGYLDVWSHREAQDLAECVEWAGRQDWSTGKIGLNGISYFAMNQWQAAALQPDHLEAICPWEGAADFYRDASYHGGIYTTWAERWYARQVETVQHGVSENGYRSRMTGDWVAGPETLSELELDDNRADLAEEWRTSDLITDEYWQSRNPDWSRVDVPMLSAGNWGGHGLHLRGNTEGYVQSASEQKWLEIHGGAHWTHFYTDYGRKLQKRFFDHFLKGEENGWEEKPSVHLQVRHPGEEYVQRHEDEWPIPRTDWTRYHLHANDLSLSTTEPSSTASVTYEALGDGVSFLSAPLGKETEITGPISAKLFVESDTEDADLFVVVRAFHPDMEEIVFQGAVEPNKPIGLGWLRASHRKLDEELSTEWRPYHTHDEVQPLEPGEIYELDIEVWPTSIVLPAGTRLGISIRGRDYEYTGNVEHDPDSMEGSRGFTGVGAQTHRVAGDRPPEIYGGDVTVHTSPTHPSSVLLPVIPEGE
jgi:predicted acyl esterase